MPRGIYSTPLTTELRDAVIRLLECLWSLLDARCLGRQTTRELIYRILRGGQNRDSELPQAQGVQSRWT